MENKFKIDDRWWWWLIISLIYDQNKCSKTPDARRHPNLNEQYLHVNKCTKYNSDYILITVRILLIRINETNMIIMWTTRSYSRKQRDLIAVSVSSSRTHTKQKGGASVCQPIRNDHFSFRFKIKVFIASLSFIVYTTHSPFGATYGFAHSRRRPELKCSWQQANEAETDQQQQQQQIRQNFVELIRFC